MSEKFQSLVELCERSCARYAERPLYGTRRDGVWHWITYRRFHELVDGCRAGLAALGVGKGDRVAMISDNSVEWAVAAYATYGREAAFVPMYTSQRPEEWQFILNDCGAKIVIGANDKIVDALRAMKSDLPGVERIIGIALPQDHPDSWRRLIQGHPPVPPVSPEPSSICGFIYTSGTTGLPKGVLLDHHNIASNVSAVHEIFSFEPEDRSLSFLPWAHSYGQTVEVHGMLSMGCSVAINDSLDRLLPNLVEVKPTVLCAVPRIFNRLYEAVSQQIEERPAALRKIIRAGVRAAIKRRKGEHLKLLERLAFAFDDKLVFAKIRERVGGRLKYAVSASATLGRDVAEFIDAVGLTVYEGYGLTETSPIVSANLPGHRRFGSVGLVLPGVKVHIDTSAGQDGREGEIVVYGPNVMVGYHKRPEENRRALQPDGGFRTGDLGYLDQDNFLYITGRIKELYKLENGKYVMPAPLEEELKMSPYIANAMIHGDGHPYNVALVVIDEPAVRKWAASQHLTLGEDPTQDEHVRALIRQEVLEHVQRFRRYEAPRDFLLIREDFTPQNGLLTPTLKLRRRDVLQRYGAQLEALYGKKAPSLVEEEAQPRT